VRRGRATPADDVLEAGGDEENSDQHRSEETESRQDQLFVRMQPGTKPKDAIAIMVETFLSEAEFDLDSKEAQKALEEIKTLEFVDIGDGWFAATGEGMLPLPSKGESLDSTPFVEALGNHKDASIRFAWLMDDDTRFDLDMEQLNAGAMFFGGLMTSLREMKSTSGGLWLGQQPQVVFEMQFDNEDDAQQFKTSLDKLVNFFGLLITFGSDESNDPEVARKMQQTRAALSLLFLNRDGANLSKTIDVRLLQRMADAGLPWTNLLESEDTEGSEELSMDDGENSEVTDDSDVVNADNSLPKVRVLKDAEGLTAKRVQIVGTFKVIDKKYGVRRYFISTKQEDAIGSPNQNIDPDDQHVFEMSFDEEEIINVGQFHDKRVIVTGKIYYFPGEKGKRAETVFMLQSIKETSDGDTSKQSSLKSSQTEKDSNKTEGPRVNLAEEE